MKRVLYTILILIIITACKESNTNMAPYKPEIINSNGHLFIIGGGERPDYMMQRFLNLAPGGEAKVLIVPFASGEPELSGLNQREQFVSLGASSCNITLEPRESIDSPESLKMLDGVNAIFFSGGDQNQLTAHLQGTNFLNKIYEIYRAGGVVGGTSAGAAIMSKVMITGREREQDGYSENFASIENGRVVTDQGFGFLENIIIDQHFLYRKRENRMFSVLLDNPQLRGIGIDEATAIIVNPNSTIEVLGESKVMIFEPTYREQSQKLPSFIIRILSSGESYSLME